jgi:hypothetical protein
MVTAHDIREWMKQVMAAHSLSPAAWARMAGIAPSTIQRAIKEDYQFVTSSRTLGKLATAVGESPPRVDQPLIMAPTYLPIRHEVGAGLWRAVDDMSQVELGEGPVLADPAYSQFAQWLERVVGDSMNLEYPPSTLLHVVDTIDLGFAPRAGDHVIVERTRDQGGTVERTVKEIAFNAHGMQLIARSSNPRWANHPIVVTPDGRDLDHCEVRIVGLVLGSYRSRRPG